MQFSLPPLNIFLVHSRLLSSDVQYRLLISILECHQDAINSTNDIVSDVLSLNNNDDYLDTISNEQSQIIESILGCSFVASQVYITYIISNIMSLHRNANRRNIRLQTTSNRKLNIISNLTTMVGSSNISIIQSIDALANYYKHKDQWNVNWTNEARRDRRSALTINILNRLGLSSGSTGNMQTGLSTLGWGVDSLTSLADEIHTWQNNLAYTYTQELRDFELLEI